MELGNSEQSTISSLHEVMMAMPEGWRYRWCSGGPCGCLGGANCSGRLATYGFTHDEWKAWVEENPDQRPPQGMVWKTPIEYKF